MKYNIVAYTHSLAFSACFPTTQYRLLYLPYLCLKSRSVLELELDSGSLPLLFLSYFQEVVLSECPYWARAIFGMMQTYMSHNAGLTHQWKEGKEMDASYGLVVATGTWWECLGKYLPT